jgi:hypothetical protein
MEYESCGEELSPSSIQELSPSSEGRILEHGVERPKILPRDKTPLAN